MSKKKRPEQPPRREKGTRRVPAGFGVKAALVAGAVFLFVVLKNAWACDDAYIIFRSLEQLFAGNGPVWNPHERVQAYTSPLWYWLLAIPRVVSSDVWLNAVVLSVVFATATVLVIRRALRDDMRFVIAMLLLVCCNGFMDFTTSGLENPLAYFLIALYLLYYIRLFVDRGADPQVALSRLALAFGLLLVTRHDLLLLVAPSFVHALMTARAGLDRRRWTSLTLLALGPLAAWSLFSLVYYGALVPNTAIAKLNTGIARDDLIRQGGRYLQASLRFDTIAVVVLIAGLVVSSRKKWATWLAWGVVLDIAYVVAVGGDFMLGRFLANACLVSVIVLVMCIESLGSFRPAMTVAAALILYAVAYPHTPLKSGKAYENKDQVAGIADERGTYFEGTSIYRYAAYVTDRRPNRRPYFPVGSPARRGYELRNSQFKVAEAAMIGFLGYWAGTRLIISDRIGLTDPLQARLPAADRENWRIGHFYRAPIPGYHESLSSGQAQLVDPGLNAYYTKLKIVTESPVFSGERLKTVVALNLGSYDHYLPHR